MASDVGDAIGRIALAILVQQETRSAFLTGSVVAFYAVPYLGPGQWVTSRIAHLPRRRVLITADLIRAAAFASMALPVGVPGRLALLGLAALATPPFDAVSGALVARTVPEASIGPANGLRTATTEFAYLSGFALGGLFAGLTSPVTMLVLDAATFVFSAAVLTRVRSAREAPITDGQPGRIGDGARAVWRDGACRTAVILTSAAFAFAMIPETLVATYVDEALGADAGVTGLLAAVVAASVAVTALALKRPGGDHQLVAQAGAILCAAGAISAMSFFAADSLGLSVVAYAAIGPALATRIHAFTVLSQRIDDANLAQAMSFASGALAAAHVVAGLGGGAVAEVIGIDRTCAIAGLGLLAIGAAAVSLPAREPRHSVS